MAVVDEDALVAAARNGGGWAFERLWERLAPTVAAYVRARGVADADDVTSEVFLAAFARIGDFAGDGVQFRRFVFTLAHHKAVDDIRRRFGPRVPRTQELDAENDPRRAASAEDEALRDLYGARTQQLLDLLPDAQREVLLLRIVAELDVAEVAQLLGRSHGAVKQLQHRALITLRRHSRPARADVVGGVTNGTASAIAETT